MQAGQSSTVAAAVAHDDRASAVAAQVEVLVVASFLVTVVAEKDSTSNATLRSEIRASMLALQPAAVARMTVVFFFGTIEGSTRPEAMASGASTGAGTFASSWSADQAISLIDIEIAILKKSYGMVNKRVPWIQQCCVGISAPECVQPAYGPVHFAIKKFNAIKQAISI